MIGAGVQGRILHFAFDAGEGVFWRRHHMPGKALVKAAGWKPTRALRGLAVRAGVAELVFGDLALASVNGALEDGAL